MSPAAKLKVLDMFPKLHEDFYSKTMGGGIITVITAAIMTLLFISELGIYLSTSTSHELTVDVSRDQGISIDLDITFPFMPCAWLSLDTMDVSGDLHLDVDEHEVYKQRLTHEGKAIAQPEKHDVKATKKAMEDALSPRNATCLSCYGAEEKIGQCCNTCEELRTAYHKRGWALTNVDQLEQCAHDAYQQAVTAQKGEGCRMWGRMQVNKVAGNFHFAPGKSYQSGGGMHVHDMAPFGDAMLDFSHNVHHLNFGPPYPGMRNPLDHTRVMFQSLVAKGQAPTGMYQYFLKVVPTMYVYLTNVTVQSNQFSVTENFRPAAASTGRSLPGVFFFYDLSPIKVRIAETQHSFLHFITGVCAIVGGVFTVSGIVDAAVYHSQQLLRKKL